MHTDLSGDAGAASARLMDLQCSAAEAARLMRAMANEKRLILLCHIYGGERTVGELSGLVGLSQSAVSQHLARLRADDLVRVRRQSQTAFYSLACEKVARVIGTLHQVYCGEGLDPGLALAEV